MKIVTKTQTHINIESGTSRTSTELIILGIEITTILIVLGIAQYINKPSNAAKNYSSALSSTDSGQLKNNYFAAVLLSIIIIHNLVIGGWHTPKDFIFIGILVVIGVWVFRTGGANNNQTNDDLGYEGFTNTNTKSSVGHELQQLGSDDIDYNLPEPGRNNKSQSAQIAGSDINDAHPQVDSNELIWGNRPEHYDFVPDDIPGYLELDELRKLKRLQKKVKRDQNYKYLAQIKPYDSQSMHRPESEPGTGLLLHQPHGLDNVFLANADKHKAYELPKEVLDALSNSPYGVWKEGARCSKDVKSRNKYLRNNGVHGSRYKFLNEPEHTLMSGDGIKCSTATTTTTTRPEGTSPQNGAGPVMRHDTIQDDMITANSKFRTVEYFTTNQYSSDTNDKPIIPLDTNTYSLYSDAINQRLPGCSDKISQYATNYPLVSKQSLERINNNLVELFANYL